MLPRPRKQRAPAHPQTVFLLSPAHCGGRRAQILLSDRAAFPLAIRLREQGAPIGDVFSFLSGLYFRGRLAYGRAFAHSPTAPDGALVITPGRGRTSPDTTVGLPRLRCIASAGA